MKKRIILQWFEIVAGLTLFALGVHLTIFANIGLSPWDCFGMGISYHIPLNYGLTMTVISVIILIVDVILGEKIGFGTLIDALITGNLVQLFNTVNPFPINNRIWFGVILIIVGLCLMAVGQMLYMRAGQCCGPRDSLLVALGKRMKKIPIGFVEIILWAVVLFIGWLLGGPIGIGTLVGTFGGGFVMQLIYSFVGFEPRKVIHKNISDTIRILKS